MPQTMGRNPMRATAGIRRFQVSVRSSVSDNTLRCVGHNRAKAISGGGI